MTIESSPDRQIVLVGYVLAARALDLAESPQLRHISDFCRARGYNLVYSEKECGLSKDFCRPGLWRVTRALACYRCDPGLPTDCYQEPWLGQAMRACDCAEPEGVDGIVVSSIQSICSDPVNGSKYALMLAIAGKHLFAADKGACVSCCNPAAAPFMQS